ncbi:HAMP domain-containing sensor histidine kinase [Burkholderia sp. Ax-1719]|uniref:sensor histidine kinase n=1 Tax=Burkholderia sp. Ax-1719 TaxID=2608334 RepID=UPI001421716F|nr:HAMP domain-containing sensor histidine kinase [Burkholderia sp. Ax-1719]NIE64799.1 HAMP domain-containing histidine kinase [Burkholderia sp. Ax-1719]
MPVEQAASAASGESAPRPTQRTLARELVLAYLIVAVLVGALLSLVSMWTVNRLETHLQQIDMGMALDRVRGEFLAGKDVGRGSRFFHGEPGSETFPEWLRQVEPGFTRIEHNDRDWHVIADDRDGVRYVLLRDYTAFEQRRVRSHWLTVLCVGASLFVAFLLGGAVTRRVVRPLVGLAEQVIKRPALPPQTRIAHAYPGNEIGRLAAAFDATYNQLEMALQREKLFTADVSHELRTPLTVISSSCELLLDDPELTPMQQQKLQRVHSASIDIHQQLAAYLMLARDSSDASGFTRSTVADAVEQEVTHWTSRADRLGLRLIADYDKAADPTGSPTFPAALVRIALSNLIRNALQHASSGTQIVVHASAAAFEVTDDGPGIAADIAPQVFAPFVRGGAAQIDNLGLGLSLVQRICDHQGWHITLDSQPGNGARFHIDLAPASNA